VLKNVGAYRIRPILSLQNYEEKRISSPFYSLGSL
jgi:hypothetical protein